jgi:hypothetical protein
MINWGRNLNQIDTFITISTHPHHLQKALKPAIITSWKATNREYSWLLWHGASGEPALTL